MAKQRKQRATARRAGLESKPTGARPKRRRPKHLAAHAKGEPEDIGAEVRAALERAKARGERPKPSKGLTVTVRRDVGRGRLEPVCEPVPWAVHAVSHSGELFVYGRGRCYVLTHRRTGREITNRSRLKDAVEIMDALDELVGWAFDDVDAMPDRELSKAARITAWFRKRQEGEG